MALLTGAADPHPGHPQPMVAVANFAFAPQTINAYTNDTVLWTWNGPDTNHSVTSDSKSPKQFDSDPGKSSAEILHASGYGFTGAFDKPGTYTYHCKVHSNMTGTVVVKDPPSTTPAAPKLSAAKVRMSARVAKVTLTGHQKSDLQLVVTRRARTRTLREVATPAPPGTSTRRIR